VVFFLVAPGVVGGLIPWWLTGWRAGRPVLSGPVLPLRLVGALLVVAGAGVLVLAFTRFVAEGAGTPAPVAPTEHLVIGGLYRHVRNPMYVAVLTVVVGQAVILGRLVLVSWAVLAGAAMVAFVRGYEEPALTRRYGDEYELYRRAVPGWWPRWRAWEPAGPAPDGAGPGPG
jgi:protein-S-isoprenylcysteine O-methyltransferase Ste14